jgi:DNA-binding SARP family transcriptional activator
MTAGTPTAGIAEVPCPNCGSPIGPSGQCGECGHVPGAPDSVAPWFEENWEVVVRPDRVYYDRLDPDGTEFPEVTYSRRVPLMGDHISIGRRSRTKRITPDVDLSDALEDTAASHRHAVLMRQPQGSWALVDRASTNGTYLNDDVDPVPPNQPIPLSDGDRIHLGYWTTMTIERLEPSPSQEPHLEAESRPSKDTRNLAQGRRMVDIDLLGPLALRVRGDDVPVTARQERVALSLLALKIGSPVPTLDFELALWGDKELKTPTKTLQMYVSNLRKHLKDAPDDTIETTSQGYRLQGPRDSVDVFRFERRCARGRSLLQSGHPGAAVAEIDRALDLWRGEPMLDLVDTPNGTAEIVAVTERKLGAEEDRFEARLQLGQHQELVADLSAAVEAEPLRQRRWGLLMLALYRSGREAEAHTEYKRLYDLLVEEHGLEPSAEIVALDEAILVGRADLQWSPPSEGGEAPPSVA